MKPVLESRADLTNVMGHRGFNQVLLRGNGEALQGPPYGGEGRGFPPNGRYTLGYQYGDDLANHSAYSDTNIYYNNGRGFWVTGNLGSKSFQTMSTRHR